MKITELMGEFNEYLKVKGFSERTIRTYMGYTRIFGTFLEKINISQIEEIERSAVSRYQTSLCTKNEYNPRMIGLKTQSSRIVAVMSFCKFLHRNGYLSNNPASHVDVPRTPRSLPKTVFNKKEVLAILKAPDKETPLGIRDKAILELFYSTGIRNTEMRELSILDVDLANGLMKVKGKGNKERIIPVGEVAGWHLQEYMARSRPVLACGKETDILFLSKNGRGLTEDFPAWMVRKYAKEVGITRHVNAHTFRHTFATHMLKRGANLRIVQEMLGHASLDTTQIYTKVEVTDLKKVHSRTHPREVDMV